MSSKAAAQGVLGPNEARKYKQLTHFYDNREYMKGVHVADEILARVPNHGETLALKGLCCHALDKPLRENDIEVDPYKLVRAGIRECISSPTCWHALGMLHRSDKNYTEAIKSFRQALKLDPENANLLRDLSSMLVQVRDWDGFCDVRQRMLSQKANVRINWVTYAVAHHMLGNHSLAAAILEVMRTIMDAGETPMEVSEVHLFLASLYVKAGQPAKTLEVLEDETKVNDDIQRLLLRCEAYTQMGDKSRAEQCCWKLLDMRYAEADTLMTMAKLRGVEFGPQGFSGSEEQRRTYIALLDEAASKNKKSDAAKRMALECVPLGEFKDRLAAYCTPFVLKTIPSLFSVLKSLYRQPQRVAIIEEMFHQWHTDLEKGVFAPCKGDSNPTCILWVKMFLASHYCRKRDFAAAHQWIEAAIRHTPTSETLYLMKGKILRHQGAITEAAAEADRARKMDLQDRYLNTKCAKYMLRAGLIDEAERTLALFLKSSEVNDTYLTMFDSQCAWFERELGDAYMQRKDYISALQCYLLLDKHRKDNHEEMADFHTYTLRRGNIRSWTDAIATHDQFQSSDFAMLLAPRIVRAYMAIHRAGKDATVAQHQTRPELPTTTKPEEDASRTKKVRELVLNVNIDDPLAKAAPSMSSLLANRGSEASSHELAFEFYRLKEKPLLVLRSLIALQKHCSDPALVQRMVVEFRSWQAADGAKWDAAVQAAVAKLFKA